MPEGPGGRLVAEAFHCRLKGPVQVDKKTLVELQGFQAVSVRGVPGVHQAPGVSGGRMLGRPHIHTGEAWGSGHHWSGLGPVCPGHPPAPGV